MAANTRLVALTALALASCSKQGVPVSITGSSTVAPFSQAVADAYVKGGEGRIAPVIESTGTIAGIKTFCAGPRAPDMLNASRRINRQEFALCQTNRVGEILEIPIGLDGIALAESNAGPKLSLTSEQLYRALAASPMGKPNTAKLWRDIDPALPAIPIKVLGPPASSGTRDSFVTLIMEPGCIQAMPQAAPMRGGSDPAQFDRVCRQIRTDGPYVAAGEDYNATAAALTREPQAVGLFGYSYLEQNAGKLHGVPINGVAPSTDTISRGTYPGGRQLYLYAKKKHLTAKPATQEFLNLYASMWNRGGPLTKAGLVAMSPALAKRSLATVQNGFPLEADDLP